MSLLNCDIYQRGRVSRVAYTELVLLIAHLIRPPGSIPGVGWVKRYQINTNHQKEYHGRIKAFRHVETLYQT